MKRPGGAVLWILATSALMVAAPSGCGGDEEHAAEPPSGAGRTGAEVSTPAPGPPTGEVTEPAEPGPPENDEEAGAVAAARSYVIAIDSRDADATCALLAPGSLEGIRGVSGPCRDALAKAVGRPPSGGAPAWDGTRIEHLVSVVAEADRARVTLEVFHRFSDRQNPSVEDDVVFLERRDGRWLVSKPDATLYRAVGYPEPPLRAFTAPPG